MTWTTYESPDGLKQICISTTLNTGNSETDFSIVELILREQEERDRQFKKDLYRQLFGENEEGSE